jgi:hypothetical protein
MLIQSLKIHSINIYFFKAVVHFLCLSETAYALFYKLTLKPAVKGKLLTVLLCTDFAETGIAVVKSAVTVKSAIISDKIFFIYKLLKETKYIIPPINEQIKNNISFYCTANEISALVGVFEGRSVKIRYDLDDLKAVFDK